MYKTRNHEQRGHDTETETMMPGEGTKGSDRYREGNQGSDGSPGESDDAQVHVTMVTGVHHNEQPGDLEAGAHVTSPENHIF
jgi:hypothetical protein